MHRGMYTGRGIIAPNTQPTQDMVDERGYLPVEWWIMSRTAARNAVPVENEGAQLLLGGGHNGDQLLLGGRAQWWSACCWEGA